MELEKAMEKYIAELSEREEEDTLIKHTARPYRKKSTKEPKHGRYCFTADMLKRAKPAHIFGGLEKN